MMNPDYGISQKPRELGLAWLQGEIKRAREKPDRNTGSGAQDYGSTAGSSAEHTADSASGASHPSSLSARARRATRFKLLSADELKQIPPPQWLLPDLIVANGFAVLYGPPGVGKSFLALDFALSIATGCEGVVEARYIGPVVYVAAEGQGGLRKRIEAWEKACNCKAENIYFLPEPVNLIEEAETKALISAIGGLPAPPRLIVLDTMARCLSGADENSSKDVGAFVGMTDTLRHTFNCAVLVVHHGTKSNAQTERGSSALRGAVDTMLFLSADVYGLVLSCEKQKDAAPFESFTLNLETVELGEGEASCVVCRGSGTQARRPRALTRHEQAVLAALDELGGNALHTTLEERFRAGEGNPSASSFDRALRNLKTQGLIEKLESGRYVRPASSATD
jgi:RecA-family ATPase